MQTARYAAAGTINALTVNIHLSCGCFTRCSRFTSSARLPAVTPDQDHAADGYRPLFSHHGLSVRTLASAAANGCSTAQIAPGWLSQTAPFHDRQHPAFDANPTAGCETHPVDVVDSTSFQAIANDYASPHLRASPECRYSRNLPTRRDITSTLMSDVKAPPAIVTRCWSIYAAALAARLVPSAAPLKHQTPQGEFRTQVNQYQVLLDGGQNVTNVLLPRLCNQCDNAPCVPVCPVQATFQREDGIVVVDDTRCVGCAYCVQARPMTRVLSIMTHQPPINAPSASIAWRPGCFLPAWNPASARPTRTLAGGLNAAFTDD